MKCKLIGINCRYTHSCPSLFYIREALQQHLEREVETEILQLTINEPHYQSLIRIKQNQPDVLFFSAYIWNSEQTVRLVNDLRGTNLQAVIIIGGPQAMFLPDLPPGCTIISGAIEQINARFYTDLQNKKMLPFYEAEDLVENFAFPYQEQDFSGPLKHRQLLYESSRGCPFSCSYCLSASSKNSFHKPVATVGKELDKLMRAEPPLVKFIDRTFNDIPDRALAIWQLLSNYPGKTRFHFEVAPDRFTRQHLDFLKQVPVGRFQFEAGIQSTNPATLQAVNRKMNVNLALSNLKQIKKYDNIHLHVDLILGLPLETSRSFAQSFRKVFACQPHHIQMGLLKVMPGTPINKDKGKYGIIHCSRPPYEILAHNSMSNEEINHWYLFGECVERFYNNRYFPSIFRYIKQSGQDPVNFFTDLLTICMAEGFMERAATQESMAELLCKYINKRKGQEVMKELLIFDWLRTGHRYLPDFLSQKSLNDIRNQIRKSMPQSLPPHYEQQGRNKFFKQGIFYPFSKNCLSVLGINTPCNCTICFLAEKENSLLELRKYIVLQNN